jgi:putative ABC transport system permease protein
MIKNFLTVAVRNLLRRKGYAFINILGLAVGIAATALIFLYVRNELSFDRFHTNADRTYRVVADWSNRGDSRIHQLGTPFILAQTIREKYPQVEFITQISGPFQDIVIRHGEKAIKLPDVLAAESSFFDVFSFPLIRGNPKSSLRDPNTVVLSATIAATFFGEEDPLDKTVEVKEQDQWTPLKVTGVVRDAPQNSHFRFDMLISMTTIYPKRSLGWTTNNYKTYITLRKGVTQRSMEEKLVELDKLYFEGGREHIPWIWTLEPITRIHLQADLVTGNQPNGSISYVRLFTAVAILILLIAGINYINLATARSARRAKEVGLRKVAGSLRSQLILQFLGESILMSLIAFVLAVALIQAALPIYQNLTGRTLGISYFSDPFVLPGILGLALIVGLLSGLYPAFLLSSFKLTDVLKGSPMAGRGWGALALRNGLVVFQFAVSVLLIIGSLVIYRQLDYVKNQNLGFDKEHVLMIHNADLLGDRLGAFEERLKQKSYVLGVTATSSIPGQGTSNWGIGVQGGDPNRPLNMNFMTCDQDFAKVLNIQMVEGRFMSRDFPSDSGAVVINKKAAEYLGIDHPLGKKMRIWWTHKDLSIIGIIDDFHFESLHKNVRSMGYLLPEAINSVRRPYLLVKTRADMTTDILADIRKTWESMSGGLPTEFTFLDEKVNSLYQNDERAGKIVTLFSFLAIFVSCLGLFGLAAFVAEQRTREIGIRKVLGASLANIMWHLTGQFAQWVIVANLIAWPVSYWIMSRWLEGFAFRTSLSIWIFLVSGLLTLTIAVSTVSSQVFRAALANPADSLKYE